MKKRHRQTIIRQAGADEKHKPAHAQTIILPFVDNCLQAQIIMCEEKSIEKNRGYVHIKILHNAIEKNVIVGMLNNHFRLKESEHAQMINLTGTD